MTKLSAGNPPNNKHFEENPMFNFILKALPLFTVILILLGISNAIVFYKIFRINIVQFISLSESALFSLDYIILIGTCFFLAIIPFFTALSDIVFKQKNHLVVIYSTLFGIAIILLCRCIYFYYNGQLKISRCFSLARALEVGVILVSLIFHLVYRIVFPSVNRVNRYFIMAIILISLVIIDISINSAFNTKYKSSLTSTIITMKGAGEIIKTSDTLIYVGKVEKYYLLYDRVYETGMAVSVDDVRDIRWVKNNFPRSLTYIDSLVMHKK